MGEEQGDSGQEEETGEEGRLGGMEETNEEDPREQTADDDKGDNRAALAAIALSRLSNSSFSMLLQRRRAEPMPLAASAPDIFGKRNAFTREE